MVLHSSLLITAFAVSIDFARLPIQHKVLAPQSPTTFKLGDSPRARAKIGNELNTTAHAWTSYKFLRTRLRPRHCEDQIQKVRRQGRSSSRRASLPEFGFTYLHPSAIARCGPTFLPRAHHGTEIFQTFDGHWFMTL